MTNHPLLGLVDVYAAILPTLKFNPSLHINYAETVVCTDNLIRID